MKDNTLLTHSNLEKTLIKKYEKKLPKPDLFNQNIGLEDQLHKAYELHNKEIGWKNEKHIFGKY
jgi:hypothetical protein